VFPEAPRRVESAPNEVFQRAERAAPRSARQSESTCSLRAGPHCAYLGVLLAASAIRPTDSGSPARSTRANGRTIVSDRGTRPGRELDLRRSSLIFASPRMGNSPLTEQASEYHTPAHDGESDPGEPLPTPCALLDAQGRDLTHSPLTGFQATLRASNASGLRQSRAALEAHPTFLGRVSVRTREGRLRAAGAGDSGVA